ncbi:MAG: glycosyltransferase [Actinobacteria bacterium]|nr:glycosyltransferase [Actinomycetota bacterium]
MDPFLWYNYFITALLVIILVNFIINNVVFKNILNFRLDPEYIKNSPLVSILIPARNEEKNIKRCINSLLKQDYNNLEILVLDDNSTDRTAQEVLKISAKDMRVRLVSGKPLPTGWMGKSYACHQLSRQADGDYLVFTDADTLHGSSSISSSLAALLKNRLDALSVFPRQIMVSIHERMVVVFIHIAIMVLLPISMICKLKTPKICIANGQFMMFRKKAYYRCGGHRSVKNAVIEDVALSKQAKSHGLRFMIFDGRAAVFCRMYHGLKEVIRGFSKFIFLAMSRSILKLTFVIKFLVMLFLMPFILLPLGLYFFHWPARLLVLIATQVAVTLVIKIVLAFRFRERMLDIIFHPLSIFYIAILSFNSVCQSIFSRKVYWKGRIYDFEEEKIVKFSDDNLG